VGAIMALSTLGGLVLLPVAGLLAERWPRRTFVAGAWLQGAGHLGLSTFDVTRLGFGLSAGVMSLGTSLIDVTGATVLARCAPPRSRTAAFAYYFLLINFARNVLGSMVAERLIEAASFATTCRAFALASLAHGVLRLVLPLPAARAEESGQKGGLSAFLGSLRALPAGALLLGFFLLGASFVAQESFLSALSETRRLGPVSPFYLAYFTTIASVRLGLAGRVDRLGHRRVMIVSGAGVALTAAGLGLVASPPLFIALGALSGASHALLWPALYAQAYARLASSGFVSAALSLLMILAGFAAELGLASLSDERGYGTLYFQSAACALAGVALLPLAMRRPREQGDQ
jgi:MFS family permease